MSWMKSLSDGLFNLDDVRKFEINELAEDEDRAAEITHGVFAYSVTDADDDDASYVVCTGTEEECRALLDLLATKLPMVKF